MRRKRRLRQKALRALGRSIKETGGKLPLLLIPCTLVITSLSTSQGLPTQTHALLHEQSARSGVTVRSLRTDDVLQVDHKGLRFEVVAGEAFESEPLLVVRNISSRLVDLTVDVTGIPGASAFLSQSLLAPGESAEVSLGGLLAKPGMEKGQIIIYGLGRYLEVRLPVEIHARNPKAVESLLETCPPIDAPPDSLLGEVEGELDQELASQTESGGGSLDVEPQPAAGGSPLEESEGSDDAHLVPADEAGLGGEDTAQSGDGPDGCDPGPAAAEPVAEPLPGLPPGEDALPPPAEGELVGEPKEPVEGDEVEDAAEETGPDAPIEGDEAEDPVERGEVEAPAEADEATVSAGGDRSEAPTQGVEAGGPAEGAESELPGEIEDIEAPAEGADIGNPAVDEEDGTPVGGDGDELPGEGDSAGAPAEDEAEPPHEGAGAEPPAGGEKDETPAEGDEAEGSAEDDTAEKTLEGDEPELPADGAEGEATDVDGETEAPGEGAEAVDPAKGEEDEGPGLKAPGGGGQTGSPSESESIEAPSESSGPETPEEVDEAEHPIGGGAAEDSPANGGETAASAEGDKAEPLAEGDEVETPTGSETSVEGDEDGTESATPTDIAGEPPDAGDQADETGRGEAVTGAGSEGKLGDLDMDGDRRRRG